MNQETVDKFGGMKWDADFIEKFYDMQVKSEKCQMVDDKRIDGTLFKFLEPGHENDAVLTIAKHKYALKKHQLNPFIS